MSRPHLRYEAILKVTGKAQFEGEVAAPGMLHASLIEAPIASGEVLAIDTAQAEAVPGFAGIVTYADAELLQPSAATALIRSNIVHFRGQPVALVAAETLLAAKAVAHAVRLQTAAHPSVTGMRGALESAIIPVSAGRSAADSARGDVQKAMGGADLVLKNTYVTAVNNHHPLEPHAVVCWWEANKAIVHTCTQAIFAARSVIAHAFDMPVSDVRVIARYLGGGFGCKLSWPWMLWAILAARKMGRPIRLELTRAQMFTLVGRRQETEQNLALGFTDGRLIALEHDVIAQTATHGDYCDPTAVFSRLLYACGSVRTTHRLVRTHEPQPVPMRAPGSAPGTFAIESAMDEAAEKLGADPVELRVRSIADFDQEFSRPWSSNNLLECYRAGAARFGWPHRRSKKGVKDGRWWIGCGMATTLFPATRQACKAHVHLKRDGTLLVQCGTQDMGSGTYTALGQIAAGALGIPMNKVTVKLGDTLLPDGPISSGAQVTASIYPAVSMAASKIRTILANLTVSDETSPLAGKAPQELAFENEMVVSRPGNAGEALIDALSRAPADGLTAEGEVSATDQKALPRSGMGYGAIFAEIGVDRELGEVRVRRVTAAFAAGRILNPLLAESQFIGGLIGGIGMALHEETMTDRATGNILGKTLSDYLIPVHADMPEFDVAMIEEDDPYLPGGVKGIGMLSSAGIQAAIANAIFDAIGKRVRKLPIRIEDCIS